MTPTGTSKRPSCSTISNTRGRPDRPAGGPSANLGFAITPFGAPPVANDFRIGLGRYYVDGILCEADSETVGFVVLPGNVVQIRVDQWTLDGMALQKNQWVGVFDDVRVPGAQPAFNPTVVQITVIDQSKLTLTLQGAPAFATPASPKVRRVITYLTQPDYPQPPALAANASLVYLDVWERLISYVEDDVIREVALGGPDTAARSKVVWQVKTVPGRPGDVAKNASPCDNFTPTDPSFPAKLFGSNRGRLKAMAKQNTASTNPCIIPASAAYRGPENQLYRVEIHRAGGVWDGTGNGIPAAATFKWSRENGSVAFPIVNLASGSGTTTVTLETLGRDDRLGLAEGQWCEIQDDISVLQNRAEALLQIFAIDRSNLTVTLTGITGSKVRNGTARPAAAMGSTGRRPRRWRASTRQRRRRPNRRERHRLAPTGRWRSDPIRAARYRSACQPIRYRGLLADSRAYRHPGCRVAHRNGPGQPG